MFRELVNDSEGVLVMVVVLKSATTSAVSLKRFVFPHPRFLVDKSSSLQSSVFSGDLGDCQELSIDNELNFTSKEVPTVCDLVDELNVYIGCESGALIHVRLDPLHEAQNFSEAILKESGPLLSALRGLLPLGAKKQNCGVSGLAVHGPLVFVLYEDAKLRVWSLTRNNALVLSIDIPVESWNPESPSQTSKWGLRILSTNGEDYESEDEDDTYRNGHKGASSNGAELYNASKKFKLGLYLGLSGDSQVQVYDGTYDVSNGTITLAMEGVSYYGNDRFVDFAIAPAQSLSIDEDARHPRVWGLWQGLHPEDGDYVLAHAQLVRSKASQVLEVNNWTEAKLENASAGLDSLVSPTPSTHPNLADAFLRQIFQPGRFTSSIILHALELFANTLININQISSVRELKAIVATELRREILQRQSEANASAARSTNTSRAGSPTRNLGPALAAANAFSSSASATSNWRIAHATWTRFLETCIQVWKSDNKPLALFCVPNSHGLVIIIKASQISVLRESTIVESLRLLTLRSRATFQHALLATFAPSIASGPHNTSKQFSRTSGFSQPSHRRQSPTSTNASELFKTLDVMSSITAQIGSAKLETFEQRLFNLTDPVASATVDVEYLFGSPLDYQSANGDFQDDYSSAEGKAARRSFLNRFIRSARSIGSIPNSLEQLLHLANYSLRSTNPPSSSERMYPRLGKADSEEDEEGRLDSDILIDVVSRGFQQSVGTTFELLRDMLYLALLCIRAELQLNLDSAALASLHAILPRIASQLKAYHVMKWISLQWVVGNPMEAALDSSMRRAGLTSPVSEPLLRRRLALGPISVVQLYLMDVWEDVRASQSDFRLWRAVSSLVSSLVRFVHPETILNDACSFSNQLLFRGQHLSLFDYIRLLGSRSAYHRDLLGDCYLTLAQYEKALECYIQASISIDLETSSEHSNGNELSNPLVASIRNTLSREREPKESTGLYYWKALLPDLVNQGLPGLAIRAANMALSTTDVSDESTFSLLYGYIFSSALEIDHYEQAYSALIHIFDDTKRMQALSDFVLTCIERGKARELAELPFVNMMDQVHSIVLQAAKLREVSPVGSPSLYQVLYGFHIAKSNYRLAAEAMFIFSERLIAEQHLRLGTMEQYNSALLAVISALKLIEPTHAYLVSRKASVPASPHKRARDELSSNLNSLHIQSHAPKSVEIYNIARLETMYLIAQCNLSLARRDKSILLPGVKNANSTLLLLLNHNEFELAYRLSSKAKIPMNDIFTRHTLFCLRQSSSSKSSWNSLRSNLAAHDLPSTNLQYHVIVADTILSTDRRVALPVWLVESFKLGHASPLVQSHTAASKADNPVHSESSDKSTQLLMVYVKHGLVEDAAKLANEIILRARQRLESYTDASQQVETALPYTYIEQTLLELQTAQPPNVALHAKVASALKQYLDIAVDKTNLKLTLQEDD